MKNLDEVMALQDHSPQMRRKFPTAQDLPTLA